MVKTNIQTFPGEVEILSNLHVGSYFTANGAASNVLEITGNVGATFFVGDGGFLSNIATTLNDITNQGNVISNVVTFEANTHYGGIGFVTSSNVGIQNTNPLHTLSVGDKVIFDDNTVESSGQSVIQVDGRISATRFQGDGGLLSNIATTLSSIVNQGNVASNCIILEANAHYNGVGLVTSSNVGIQNTNPTFDLSVGSNLHVDDTGANVLTVHGNVTTNKLNLGVFSITPAYGLNDVCSTSNGTSNVVQFQNSNTSIVTTSNINVGGQVIITGATKGLDVTSNIELGGRLKFDSNVFIDTLRVADVAANLVTYDRVTGELTDSGGTFLNKFAIVSEQPPSDLFANATTVTDHGSYTLTTSNLATNSNTYNAFDGTANAWTGGTGMYIGGSNVLIETNLTQLSNLHPTQFGDWLAIEFPYKTTLRHMKLTPATVWQSFPYAANLYATNNDLTWTEIKYWDGLNPGSASNVQTITVNATEQFKKYALVTTKLVPNTNIASAVALQDWQLFTESFSIDGGKVAMAQQAATGGETVMDQHGPHGRGVTPLKKYPEIVFESGKFDSNDSTNTYVQAGYSVSGSNFQSPFAPYRAFNSIMNDANARWRSNNLYVNNSSTANPSALDSSSPQTQLDTNTSIGEYLILNIPKKIKLKHIIVNAPHKHMPYEVDIYGRNEGVSTWTHVKNYIYSVPTRASGGQNTTKQDIDATEYYSEYAFVVVKTNGNAGASIGELQLYGYEEDQPLGDTSVDTTFTSIMNTPQTTGAQVYVDGILGETFTNRVVGPTVSNTHTTYVSAEKYWELSGNVESNVTLEANTFLSGDAPHSLSMWFNSSNLEANVSNSCIFSLNSGEEKLDYMDVVHTDTYQTVQKLLASDGGGDDRFGAGDGSNSLGMSGDGSVVVVGSKLDDDKGTDAGAAYIFIKDANGHWNEVQKLLASDGAADDRFGCGADISSDGNYIVIGARLAHRSSVVSGSVDAAGAIYIFKRTVGTNSWVEQQILISDAPSVDDHFGFQVNISSDGTYVVASEMNDDRGHTGSVSNAGSAYVFKRTGSTWNTTPYRLFASDSATSDYFGTALEISDDGNFVAVGAMFDNGVGTDDDGSVYMFARTGDNTWVQQQKINNPSVSLTNNYFGGQNQSVSISSDGTYLIVGAYGRGPSYNNGAVFFFQRTGSSVSDWTWSLMGSVQTNPTGATGDLFGRAVKMSPDGTVALVHSRADVDRVFSASLTVDMGAVFVYKRSGSTWTYSHKIQHKDRTASDFFGSALAISTDGSYFVAGMEYDDDLGSRAGAAYIYTRDTTHHFTTDLKLQSNTWHNLTYAYQGEGGSRVTYLDGRKVVDETIEDTYGEYPPFAMSTYSQNGYTVTTSSETNNSWLAWKAFDRKLGNNAWHTHGGYDANSTGAHNANVTLGGHLGHWIQLESPHKIKVSYFSLRGRDGSAAQLPKSFKLIGSNSGIDDPGEWDVLLTVADASMVNAQTKSLFVNSTKFYKFHALVFSHGESNASVVVAGITYYGQRENDLVRLPDPTNVLKYPHIIINEPTKRGYVVSQSSQLVPPNATGSYQAYNIFDGELVFDGGDTNRPPNGTAWITMGSKYDGSGNPTGTAATTDVTGQSPLATPGEYFQLELPHKVKLSSIRVMGPTENTTRLADRSPVDAVLAGSNNGTTWTTVLTYTGASWTTLSEFKSFPANVDSTNAYKYFRFIITKNGGNGNGSLQEFEFYGTEEATSVPIQIGGGNIDRVANFRVYDKFVGEDQALEIWDAQKDHFGRAKSSMTLQKGRLGIGTTEPQGRLAVLDEPHNLEEFPPSAMSASETHINGHGVFRAWASRESTAGSQAWEAFNKLYGSDTSSGWDSSSHPFSSGVDQYSEATGKYIGTDETHTVDSDVIKGTYIQLELPYKVKLSSFSISPQGRSGTDHNFYGGARMPETGSLVGSNDGVNWHLIGTIRENYYTVALKNFKMNTTKYYSYFRLIAQSITSLSLPNIPVMSVYSTFRNRFNLSGLVFFGVREQSQSVLHDGQLTLTKNLSVPQIGPVLGEYPTPRREKLILEYNTALTIHSDDQVIDTSGNSNDGNKNGSNPFYDTSRRALMFDGADDWIYPETHMGNTGGAWKHSFSVWINTLSSTDGTFFSVGVESEGDSSAVRIEDASSIRWFFYASDIVYDLPSGSTFDITGNSWYHVAGSYNGGVGVHSRRLWINGQECKGVVDHSYANGTPLTIEANTSLRIGVRKNNADDFYGWMSMFRIYDCALTPEEIYTLYKQGRVPPVHHLQLVDSTMTIGSHDRYMGAQLDVAGHIRAGSAPMHTFTGQHRCFPDEPVEKGLIVSAKKNQFVKLNGFATGQDAITIDESLPIVSLSNVVQDKACFGVVSSIEKSTPRRSQIVNGIISDAKKESGDNRAVVNSVGEGAIWVVDTGGALESGDYITTSNVVGYGQKQDDDILHNYTVAKITMDCDFTGSNVAVQTIKREDTGLQTIMEDTWNQLVDYDRSSNTETQYSNTLAPSAYSDQSGYTPREVTTIVDYTDGSNIVSIAEWSNLESNIQNTYQSNTFTEIVDYTKFVSVSEWSNLTTETQNTYSEAEITTYYQIQRGENVLDENGQLQFEDKTGATEAPYERRFLDVSGAQTDEANAVHIAAFVGCTYHCG